MIKIEDLVIQALTEHAVKEAPRECCGVVLVFKGRQRYWPCENLADIGHFMMSPEDYAEAEDHGEIVAIAHSHPSSPPTPSQADQASMEASGLPWLILNPLINQWTVSEPSGYKAPLYGRPFVHGVFDCYAMVKDLYKEERNLVLPEFFRANEWWLKGETLLLEDNLTEAGFVQVDEKGMKAYDGLVFQIASPTPNHVAVYLGDNQIAHHVTGRISSRDVYGHYWRMHTVKVVRHRSML